MIIDRLMIELTRRCNMACKHCLRGEPENIDIDPKDIDTLFSKVDSIYSIGLSGGEPSLVPELIEKVVESAKKHNVDIYNFYIATNGKKITPEFVLSVLKLYSYCLENEISALDYSNDEYHDNLSPESLALLDGLKFFGKKYFTKNSEEKYKYEALIRQGRASSLGVNTRENFGEEILVEDETISEATIYLNALGQIILGCDWSFEDQDYHVICEVDDFCLEVIKGICV